jgi:1-acyl-sn-glycerol-3-phosphate acyltransferase
MKEKLGYTMGRVPCRIYSTLAHDLKVYGLEHVPQEGGVVIASNHQSNLDPVLLAVQLRRPVSFLAKSELFENKLLGWVISNLNAFPVRQGEGDVGAVKETIRRLQEGHALVVYPEGSRSQTGEMMPILGGIGIIVRRAGVPVVPVVIEGSFAAWPKGSRLPRPHPVRVMYGPPMHLSKLRGAEIVERIGTTLNRMFVELREKIRREESGDGE